MVEKKVAKKAVSKAKKTAVKKTAPKKVVKKTAPKKAVKADVGFAVVETGGKQYKVAAGDTLKIEKLPGAPKEGAAITFDKILLTDDGKETKIGTPYLEGAKITAVLEGEGRAKKIMVIRFKSKSRYFKKRGHRQPFMKVKIKSLK